MMNKKYSEKLCSKMIDKFGVAGISKLDEKTYNYEKMKFIEEIEFEASNKKDLHRAIDLVEGIAIENGELNEGGYNGEV